MKTLVNAKIRALKKLQKAAQSGCETVNLDQTRVGRLSRMDALQAQAMNQAAQRSRAREIISLEAALEALDREGYGECENCGEAIGEGRLMVNPTAKYCIGCASQREQG